MSINNRYQDVLKIYKTDISEETVKDMLAKIAEKEKENHTREVYKKIYSCVDLTSLNTTDTKESIYNLVNTVNEKDGTSDLPNVAAICVYPNFVENVREVLTADVKVAAVAGGFPSAQTFIEVKVAECALAVASGADEIDVVLNLGKYYDGSLEEVYEEIDEMKGACQDKTLKVILETGAQKTLEDVVKTSLLALYSGADIIKTSTGKVYKGATPEAVYAMCYAIKEYQKKTGNKAGIKVSGGVSTTADAVKYYTIVKEVLGEDYLNNESFRIGASSLVSDLEKSLNE